MGDDDSGDGGARALLEGLAGVRAGEETGQAAPRTRPRLSVEPVHALIVMAILVVMLAASLTLLVQQSVNLADASPEPTPVTASSRAAADDDAPSCASSAPASSAQASTAGAAQGQPDATPQSQPTQQAAPQATPQLIDLNTATQEQLETVKGVGPVTAANIIAYRTSVGRFGAVDDLLNIDGIGPKTLEKIRGQVTVR
ncbi:comEA protein [Bifidobacterium castoris]|uniref:ComEA protein n=2 Tax=Bifidobacterium castoris TaxID=2306972 RepID=A0A430F7X7_9BIFI|nr:comEA protein [Bifidobacterium castoris]